MNELNRANTIFQIVVSFIFILIALITIIPVLRVVSMSVSSKNAILSGHVTIFPLVSP